jgi:hypothetical protein
MEHEPDAYPVRFAIDYPDRELDRVTTLFRMFTVIPILILLATVAGGTWQWREDNGAGLSVGTGGLLTFGPLLMILFLQKYPRWWFDWNLELLRFSNRVAAYATLMTDEYPATDQPQSVRLDVAYPDVPRDLSRWMPLVKWLLAIPHYIVLFVLYIGLIFAVVISWFAILITGRYPPGLFRYVAGVIRWHNRVVAYAFVLFTDRYPPFRLSP